MSALVRMEETAIISRENIEAELNRMLRLQAQMLPAESRAKAELQQKIRQATRIYLRQTMVEVPLDGLTWRDRDGLPELVIYDVYSKDAASKFRISERDQWGLLGGFPREIVEQYIDVYDALPDGQILSCTFQGIIPGAIRDRMAAVRPLFESMFIIAEPGTWHKYKASTDVDPLVCGWFDRRLWLIAKFDTTPIEEALAELAR